MGGKNKSEQKHINNNVTYNNYKNNKNVNKLYLSDYNNSTKLIKREYKDKSNSISINTINNININNNNKFFIFSKEKFDNKNMNKYKSKDNLKINLPEINPTSTTYKVNISYNKNTKNNNISKSLNNSKEINYIKSISNNVNANKIQRKIKNLKETFSKKTSKVGFDKSKAKEINNLYSTINFNSQFFTQYPLDRVEKYFYKYKNLRISKLNPNKGSNVHPLLDGLENIVKEKELYKLARALNETKKDIYLRSTGTLDNFEKIKVLDSEKIKEYDNKIPLLKYDFAENILCDNEHFGDKNNN